MSPQAPLYEYKTSVLAEHNISNEKPFELVQGKVFEQNQNNSQLCDSLLITLRVQRMDAMDLSRIDEVFKGKTVNKENETLVIYSLRY